MLLFDHVVIAVGVNVGKQPRRPVEQRVEDIRALYAAEASRITVVAYEGLTVDVARRYGVDAMVRGVRSVADFEYERQMADVNRQLSGIDTVCLFARPELASLSSSMVRELEAFGHDVSAYLPSC